MSTSHEYAIRRARQHDLPFLVWSMRTAATSHLDKSVWDTLLDLPSEQVDRLFATIAVSEQPHWCHLSRFWIAETAGQPVGALAGYDTATEGSAALEQVLLAHAATLEVDESALNGVAERADILRDCTPAEFPSTWGIENVAIAEHHRGSGIVDDLLAHALQAGRQRRYATAQILCLNGNHRAQRTWQRHGFAVQADYRNQRFCDTYQFAGIKLLHRSL